MGMVLEEQLLPWVEEVRIFVPLVMPWVEERYAPQIEEWKTGIRMKYQVFIRIEKMFFRYLDDPDTVLQITFRQFCCIIVFYVTNLGLLYLGDFDNHFNDFLVYWNARPRVGGIILDYTGKFILLVRPPHSWRWSFPKRKLEPHENEFERAIIEVEEETGLLFETDASLGVVTKEALNSHGIEISITLFYLTVGCATNSVITPQSTGEIGGARWFNIDFLASQSDQDVEEDSEFDAVAWKSIKPFLGDIQRFAQVRSPAHHHDYEGKSLRGFGDVRFD